MLREGVIIAHRRAHTDERARFTLKARLRVAKDLSTGISNFQFSKHSLLVFHARRLGTLPCNSNMTEKGRYIMMYSSNIQKLMKNTPLI